MVVPVQIAGQTVPARQMMAGSAHVAVLSIAPWEEYLAALQPNFPMDEQRALKEAVPDTLLAERQLTDMLSVGVKLALPSTSKTSSNGKSSESNASSNTTTNTVISDAGTTSTTTVASSTGDTTTSTTTANKSTAPGDVSKVTLGQPSSSPDPLSPTKSVLDGATPSVDPFLRYGAATALFQEVRMMQRYVRDALVAKGYRGYVVRLQITLMPMQRKLPLDAYTTLSVFATSPAATARANSQRTALASSPRPDPKTAAELTTTLREVDQPVRIVPLLVSDNLEGALESNSMASLRQYAFGLMGLLSNFGVAGDFNKTKEELKGFFGRDLNSLLTVGQLSDNSLRIRLGAMNQVAESVGLVPRNQSVTLLVVVPETISSTTNNDSKLQVIAKTELAKASDGTLLKVDHIGDFRQAIDVMLKRYGFSIDESDEAVRLMIAAFQHGSVSDFKLALEQLHLQGTAHGTTTPAHYLSSIWLDTASILARLSYNVTTIDLPAAWRPTLPSFSTGRLLVSDNGKTMVARVPGAATLRGSDLFATFTIGSVVVPANNLTIAGTGELRMDFGSAKADGVCKDDSTCKDGTLQICRVVQRWEGATIEANGFQASSNGTQCGEILATYRQTAKDDTNDKPKAPFGVAISASVIVAEDKTGSLRIDVTRKDDAAPDSKLAIKLRGADAVGLFEVDDKGKLIPLTSKGGGFEIVKTSTLVFELTNLDPLSPVTVIFDGVDKPTDYTFLVSRSGRH